MRGACVLALMVGFMPAVQADDSKAPPKPAGTGSTPAKAAAPNSAPPAPPAARAAAKTPVPEADDDLLEFLGSVDEGDEDWIDYLSQTDIAKVAKAKKEGKTE
jgi:hypothetical protein